MAFSRSVVLFGLLTALVATTTACGSGPADVDDPDIAYGVAGAGWVEVIDADSGALLDRLNGVFPFVQGGLAWAPDGLHLAFTAGDFIGIGELGLATQWDRMAPGTFVSWLPGR